jgi:WD40 repeat protein
MKARSGIEIHEFRIHPDIISALTFSPDSKFLACISNDGAVKLWDVSSGYQRQTLPSLSNNQKDRQLNKVWEVETQDDDQLKSTVS